MAKEEITAILLDERRPPNCDNFSICRLRLVVDGVEQMGREFKAVGNSEEGELRTYLTYRWYGSWHDDPKWGRQFKFETFTPAKPHGRAGVIRYLQQCSGIGEQTAVELWNLFNADAVRMCREHPDIIASKIRRLSLAQCKANAEKLKELQSLEDTSIELIDLLSGRGFPKNTIRAAINKWGNKAHEVISRDPFKLMAFRGCGFLRCDAMWKDLGLPLGKMKRQYYSLWYAVTRDTKGNTWIPEHAARRFMQENVGDVEVNFEKAVRVAVRAGLLQTKTYCPRCHGRGRSMEPDLFFGDSLVEMRCPQCQGSGGSRWLADSRKASDEDHVAMRLAEASFETPKWPVIHPAKAGERGPTSHQVNEYLKCRDGVIALLLGSPGTGKTFLAAAVVKAIISAYGSGNVAIAAPTGKAAVRCTESMASYGINLHAVTIHSLLGVESAEDGEWSFRHNAKTPLPYQFIIIDESSMLDTSLLNSLLAARGRGTHILFIGDPNQLPPVNHGAPLRDMIAAGIPHGKLTEIKRNAGTIVTVCAAIRDGKPFTLDDELDLNPPCPECNGSGRRPARDYQPAEAGENPCEACNGTGRGAPKNLVLIPATKSKAIAAIEERIAKLKETGVDPIWQIQVVVAVNKRSPLARLPLNERLQNVLNPDGYRVEGNPFRVGDKVICLDRSSFPDADNDGEKVAIANGEFGRVYQVEPRKTWIEFSNPTRRAIVGTSPQRKKSGGGDDEESGTGCDIDLGYACTCHKMQGSDCEYVLVALDDYPGATGPHGICSREWAFTGISRPKLAGFLIGLPSTLRAMCARTVLDKRKTFLKEMFEIYRGQFRERTGNDKERQPCKEDDSTISLPSSMVPTNRSGDPTTSASLSSASR